MNDNKTNKKSVGIIAAIIAALGALVLSYKETRKNRQDKLQKDVDNAYSDQSKDSGFEYIPNKYEAIEASCELTPTFEEIKLTTAKDDRLRMLANNSIGEAIKLGVVTQNFHGLLKSDIPISELCRVAGHPEYLRGFAIVDNKIAGHAKLKEVSGSVLTPVIIMQVLTVVTSQYHMQHITESLNDINREIKSIKDNLLSGDYGKLEASLDALNELMSKTKFDDADKQRALATADTINVIRKQYKKLFLDIQDVNIEYSWSGYKESRNKVKKIEASNFWINLNMAMQAEKLWLMASLVLVQIAKNLGNEEEVRIYQQRINLDFWSEYGEKYNRVKHDVIKYLELEIENSTIFQNKIEKLKQEQESRFNIFSDNIKQYQMQFGTIPIYIKNTGEDMKIYLAKPNAVG